MKNILLKRLTVIVVMVAVIFAFLPQIAGNSFNASAAKAPRVVFLSEEKTINLSNGTLALIEFESEGATVTNPAISITSNNAGLKIYEPIIEPTYGSDPGFKGGAVIQAVKGSGNAKLTVSVAGDSTIRSGSITVKLNNKPGYIYLATKQFSGTFLPSIYLKPRKSTTFKPYVFSDMSSRYDRASSIRAISAKTIKWKFMDESYSENKTIASVSKSGKVKVSKKVRSGESVLILVSYRGAKGIMGIHVSKKSGKIKRLKHNRERIQNMPLGFSNFFAYDMVYSGSPMNKAKWNSSDTSVASVDSYGLVTANKIGIAKVTLRVGGKSLVYMVNVLSPTDYFRKFV